MVNRTVYECNQPNVTAALGGSAFGNLWVYNVAYRGGANCALDSSHSSFGLCHVRDPSSSDPLIHTAIQTHMWSPTGMCLVRLLTLGFEGHED
jgi:hypothetical protein